MRFNINTDYGAPAPSQSAHVLVWEVAVSVDTSEGEIPERYATQDLAYAIGQILGDTLSSLDEELKKRTEQHGSPTVRGHAFVQQVATQKWNCAERETVWRYPDQGYFRVTVSPDYLMNNWDNCAERTLDAYDPDDNEFSRFNTNEYGERPYSHPQIRRHHPQQPAHESS